MHEQLDLLRREFEADQGTFLLGLRGEGLEWDKAAFSRFEKAMRWACEHFQDLDRLDRWMAEGFHYASWFVRDWTSHPNFPRPEPEQYYNDCIQRIGDLTDWFFRGWHVYTEPHHWPERHDILRRSTAQEEQGKDPIGRSGYKVEVVIEGRP